MLINSLWIIKDAINSIDFGALILSAFRTLIYYLDQIIYEFIINIYNLFRILCNTRITDDGKIISELAYRIGLILGLVMFFYVTFDFIQILIDPDKIQDKEKGPLNIIKKFIIVIVLLGTSTFIFDYMHRFQEIILHDGNDGVSVIERLILPYEINSDNFGKAISANFMKQFYKITGDSDAESATPVESDEGFTYEVCKENAETLPSKIASYGSMEDGLFCLNARYETDDGSRFYIEFNLLSLPIGIVVAWMLIMYCISVGMRVIQLMFLEIISPVAFVSYLSPKKDNMFGKFWKVYFATYIDVFIRIAIIDFIVLLSGVILETDNLWESASSTETFWLSVFMILALLSFAKKIPDLIKQFLPESVSGLSFGISSKDRSGLGMIGGALAGGVTGLLGGGIGGAMSGSGIFGKIKGAVSGAVSGTAGGVVGGALAGRKGKDLRDSITTANKNQATANLNRAQLRASGVTRAEQMGNAFRSRFGIEAGGAADTREINTLQSYVGLQDSIEGYADNNSVVKRLKRDYESIQQSGKNAGESDSAFAQRIEDARNRYKDAQHAFINAVVNNDASFNYTGTDGAANSQTIYYSDKDQFNVSNIKAGVEERNRIQSENKRLFREYTVDARASGNVTPYDSLDSNTNRARSDIARKSAERRREGKK